VFESLTAHKNSAMKIIIVGKSCSGKDYARALLSDHFKFGCWHTTRPKREGEIPGVHYYFVDEQQWNLNRFEVVTTYNEWKYGLSEVVWKNCSAFLGNLKFIDLLFTGYRSDSIVIYLNPPDEVIFDRLQKKSMPGDNWERRYCQDRIDFNNFTDFDVEITNPEFTKDELLRNIGHFIKL
jgi:Guanylate kinase